MSKQQLINTFSEYCEKCISKNKRPYPQPCKVRTIGEGINYKLKLSAIKRANLESSLKVSEDMSSKFNELICQFEIKPELVLEECRAIWRKAIRELIH